MIDLHKGIKNIFWGLFAQIITIAFGIFIPRLIIVNLGSSVNGLLGAIGSVFACLALLEAGVGIATQQALYSPIANGNKSEINSILAATYIFYKRTGYSYIILVFIFAMIYPFIAKTSEISRILIGIIIILHGIPSAVIFLFQGTYRILLLAEGKNYILINLATFISVCTSIAKVIILISGGGILSIQISQCCLGVIPTIYIIWLIKKYYPWVKIKSIVPNFNAISQKNSVLVHQIAGLVFNNTSVFIMSFMLPLKSISVYMMYAMIFGMIKGIVVMISQSFIYILGQNYQNKEKFVKIYDIYEVYYLTIIFALFTITQILIIPFMELYTLGVKDVNYIDNKIAWLFLIFYLLHLGRSASSEIINIAQKFKETQWRAIIETSINIIGSIIFIYFFSVHGALLGLILSMIYRANDMIIYASHKVLNRSCLISYRRWIYNFILLIICCYIFAKIPLNYNTYYNFILNASLISIIVLCIFLISNSIIEKTPAKSLIQIIFKHKLL